MTDREREALYAAEASAFDGTDLERVLAHEEVEARVAALTASAWWPGPWVVVRRARRDAGSSSTRCDVATGEGEIRFASGQLTVATAAHELAHVLAGPAAGHGADFRIAYLDVVAVLTNLDPTDRRHDLHVAQLTSAFAAAGLTVGQRRWSPPPESSWGPIAL